DGPGGGGVPAASAAVVRDRAGRPEPRPGHGVAGARRRAARPGDRRCRRYVVRLPGHHAVAEPDRSDPGVVRGAHVPVHAGHRGWGERRHRHPVGACVGRVPGRDAVPDRGLLGAAAAGTAPGVRADRGRDRQRFGQLPLGERGGEWLMVDVCDCASNWRIELANLLTGATTHVLTPVSFEFQTAFMEPGRGSITFHRRGAEAVFSSGFVPADRMFPATTGIFFSRIHGGRATPNQPVHMFGGFVETMQANSDGLVTLGFAEMQKYLDYRMVGTDLVFEDESQLSIGANLVLYARGENFAGGSVDDAPALGIPLIGGFGTSAINRDRTYLGSERPFIGELLRNLTQVIDGPVYTVDHHRNAGPIPGLAENWYTELGFSDTWLQTFPAPVV